MTERRRERVPGDGFHRAQCRVQSRDGSTKALLPRRPLPALEPNCLYGPQLHEPAAACDREATAGVDVELRHRRRTVGADGRNSKPHAAPLSAARIPTGGKTSRDRFACRIGGSRRTRMGQRPRLMSTNANTVATALDPLTADPTAREGPPGVGYLRSLCGRRSEIENPNGGAD